MPVDNFGRMSDKKLEIPLCHSLTSIIIVFVTMKELLFPVL